MSKYELISKIPGIKYTEYKGNAIRLGTFAPYTVDEVIVGLKDNPNITKKITTFKDSKGNITERIFDYPDKPLWNRLYTYAEDKIGFETVLTRTKKDYKLDRDAIDYYNFFMQFPERKKFILWNNSKTETDFVSYNLDEDKIIHSQIRVQYKNRSGRNKHTFTEYPTIQYGKKIDSENKQLAFEVRSDNSVVEKTIKTSGGATFPTEDRYIGYRALTIDDSKVPLTKRYLKERNMDDKDIKIEPNYNPIFEDEGFNAKFDPEDGCIKFNQGADFRSKSQVAQTSRHEAEHTWHFFLQALLNHGGTPWQTKVAEKSGEITNKKTLKEAKNYDKSINNYVPYYENRARYQRNYIEIKADEKGNEEREKYDFDGLEIRKTFKHIPSKYL